MTARREREGRGVGAKAGRMSLWRRGGKAKSERNPGRGGRGVVLTGMVEGRGERSSANMYVYKIQTTVEIYSVLMSVVQRQKNCCHVFHFPLVI